MVSQATQTGGELPPSCTSGHKWLLGRPSIGILAHNPNLLRRASVDVSKVRDIDRPFSTSEFDIEKDYTRETIDIEPYISLNAMLMELTSIGGGETIARHNREIGSIFARQVGRLGISVIGADDRNGIVSVKVKNNASEVKRYLEEQNGIVCQALNGNILRFSFHYYMGEKDVYELIRALSRRLDK
ncbi:MAG: aminotransferase class V-fold PLP-dependent enzyme [bacterium]|nr:aminotransferase class V-fold PLP-dependent enzyme [bacterium]